MTTYGYYGVGGTYDTTGGYYGQLWEIKTLPQSGGTAIQDLQYTWDADGNLVTEVNAPTLETENFSYDFLDRLTAVSNAYTQSYTYNQIGNITSMNGTSYTYGTKPHAVTAVGSTSYTYDANGNMTSRGGQGLTWDVENRPTAVGTESYVYDGDGNCIEKTVGGVTTLYINQYYEKNTSTGTVTTSYYLGSKLVTTRAGTTLTYIHQDSLSSTSTTSDSAGTLVSSIKYFPFGATRAGSVSTDKKFTGQRLDGTGLYYYGARYYDPTIGRFISPDTVAPVLKNPQSLNRYVYCLDNPLKYFDSNGHSPVLALNTIYGLYHSGYISQQQAVAAIVYCDSLNPFAFGTLIHEIAQVMLAQYLTQNGTYASLEQQTGAGKADIAIGEKIWEVKRIGDSSKAQLDKYTDNTGFTPGRGFAPFSVKLWSGIFMEIQSGGNTGEAWYSFYSLDKNGNRVEKPYWDVYWAMLGQAAKIIAIGTGCSALITGGIAAGIILGPEIAIGGAVAGAIPALAS